MRGRGTSPPFRVPVGTIRRGWRPDRPATLAPWIVALLLLPIPGHLVEPPWSLFAAAGALLASGLAAWRIASRIAADSWLARAAAAAVLMVTLWTLLPLALGAAGILSAALFRTLLALSALAAMAVPEHRSVRPPPHVDRETGALAALGLVLAATLVGFADRHWTAPPGAIAYDDASFHLPAVALWQHAGDLRMPKPIVGDPSTPFYPIGGELLSWGFLSLLHDNDFLARWSQLMPMLLSALLAAAIARELGVTARGAAVAALVPLAVPRLRELGFTAGNDHSLAFATLAATWAALRLRREPTLATAVALGLASGLMVGVKYLGLLFVPLVAGVVWLSLRESRSLLADGIRLITIAGVAAALVGGFTYLRNLVTTGNPVFPSPMRFGEWTLFPGWDTTALAARRALEDDSFRPWVFPWSRPELFGVVAPWLLVPAALIAPLVPLQARWGRSWAASLALASPVVVYLVFVGLVHDHREIRYILVGVWTAAVGAILLVERIAHPWIARRARPALLAGMLAGTLLPELGVGTGLAVVAGAVAIGACAGPALARGAGRIPEAIWATAAVLCLAATALVAADPVRRYSAVKLESLPAAAALERLSGPRGATVAYAGWNLPYPFAGSRLQNRIELVPRRPPLAERVYDWSTGPRDPYKLTPRAAEKWLDAVDELGIDLLVLERRGDPIEARWVRRFDERFEAAYDAGGFEIWRVIRPAR